MTSQTTHLRSVANYNLKANFEKFGRCNKVTVFINVVNFWSLTFYLKLATLHLHHLPITRVITIKDTMYDVALFVLLLSFDYIKYDVLL